jgi:hypothetical protein
LEKIKQTVEEDLFTKNQEYIKEARDLILEKYQLFPMIERLLKDEMKVSEEYEQFKLQDDGLTRTERLKRSIRKYI